MRYVDLTSNPKKESTLSLEEVQALIKATTGRNLCFENETLTKHYTQLFKLVRMPAPIGFVIVANTTIKAGTILCPYGGVNVAKSTLTDNKDIEYLLSGPNTDYAQQAKATGDLGSLLCHLPDETFANQVGLDQNALEQVQLENVEVVCFTSTGRMYLCAKDEIAPNTVLGFSYGIEYWIESMSSPILFKPNTYQCVNLEENVRFSGFAGLYNSDTGKSLLLNTTTHKNQLVFGVSLGAVPSFFQRDPATGQTDKIGFYTRHSAHLAFDKTEIDRAFEAGLTQDGEKLKQLITFFPAIQPATCAPPPGARFENGKTIVKQ